MRAGADQCPWCGFVNLDPITFGTPPARAVFGRSWLGLSSLVGGVMALVVAGVHEVNIVLGELTSHGHYFLGGLEHDRSIVRMSFAVATILLVTSLVIAIIRWRDGEPKSISRFVFVVVLLLTDVLFGVVAYANFL